MASRSSSGGLPVSRTNSAPSTAASRELAEETGVSRVLLEQLRTFGDPGRDPRTWVITVAYTALVASDALVLRADTDAADARWYPPEALPGPLAFDHQAILDHALRSVAVPLLLAGAQATTGACMAACAVSHVRCCGQSARGVRRPRRGPLQAPTRGRTAQRGRHRPALLYEFVPAPAPV